MFSKYVFDLSGVGESAYLQSSTLTGTDPRNGLPSEAMAEPDQAITTMESAKPLA
jgi:hypothetical protein